jgi:hypothetical protein
MSATYYTGDPDPDFINEWQANLKARELYDKGVNYVAISIVIEEFYGVRRSRDQWRGVMDRMGVKKRPARGWAGRAQREAGT